VALGNEHPVHPPAGRALVVGNAGLHEILHVKMRARGIGRAAGVDHRQMLGAVERGEGVHRRVQAEESVEVDRGCVVARRRRPRNRDVVAMLVIERIAMRDDHRQPVRGAALKDAHQHLFAATAGVGAACQRRPPQETRRPERARAPHRHRDPSALQEYPAIHAHGCLL